MKLKLLALLFFMGSVSLLAQDYFPINDGVKAKKNNNYMAFTNAKIYGEIREHSQECGRGGP